MPTQNHKPFIDRVSFYAKRIRDLREDSDMTQNEIAKILHVGQRTYSDYELGNTRIPIDSLIMLAEFYDVDMNYICGLDDQRRPFPRSKSRKTDLKR